MTTKAKPFLGTWRIVHMDDWDDDYLDLVAPAFITFDDTGRGEFMFGTVKGVLDCDYDGDADVGGDNDNDSDDDGLGDDCGGEGPRVEFSWEGENDSDPSCGGGSAAVRPDGTLLGYFSIDSDDEFAFVARRSEVASPVGMHEKADA